MNKIILIYLVNTILNLLVSYKLISNKATFLNIILTSVLIVIIGTKFLKSNLIGVENTIDINLAYYYPIILSVCLLGIYFIIKYFKYKDIFLKILFFGSIVSSLMNILPFNKVLIFVITFMWFTFDYLTKNKYENYKLYINNIIAITVALSSITSMKITDVKTGIILLVGLFLFDIFWVFGSKYILNKIKSFKSKATLDNVKNELPKEESVMEKIALNVNSPILLKYILDDKKPMILGLGDIILPAVFIKTLVSNNSYYNTSIVSYIFGLVSAIVATLVTGAGQPALLYIVPSVIIPVLLRNNFTDNKIF
jgi:hypothetical protein